MLIQFLLLFINLHVGFAGDIADQLSKNFAEGNSRAISQSFAENVELTIVSLEDVYSKNQAEILLKDFFTKNPVQSFNITHKSIPKNNNYFLVGNLLAGKEKYKVYILLKQATDKTTIQQLRIELDK
ncbi:MAG: DUF4783 domain-containing protein [Bacteroidetes bacterium]|nr:DUF4783 domain-containing protein [Bacteroidota bacterium]